ncbi:MAG: choice-of-anchor L domain-containing protein [Bacteroidetes bacterium]|nr:choice-of-anchor L domain-containing protein [Bacteroidota bacterium]
MKNRILCTLAILFFFTCLSHQVNAQLTVSSAPTTAQLVQNILLGPGVNASNFVFTGSNAARGSFNCAGACNVGIGNGVLLTSGSVSSAIGPNGGTGVGVDNSAGSDIDLNGLHPTGTGQQDAAVLEFDFTVATDSVRFRYVWASEEYHDYVGTACNDFFGFFINGPGITGKKNIALVPGTTTPISINNVNNGSAPGMTSPSGPCTNCAYFRDNTGGTTVQYDGMTTVLTAATQVCPCETYHIKLAVQDFCDGAFDSGVFLEGNSFQSVGEIPVLATSGQYTQVVDTLYFCQGDSIKLEINACRPPLWSTGDTTNSIWVTQPGIYYTSIANPPLCFAFSALIYVQYTNSVAIITPNGPISFCPGDSVILSATPGVSYLWSNGATTQNITAYTAGSYQCTVSFGGNCVASTNTVNTSLLAGLTLNVATSGPLTFCQGSNVTLTASSASVLWSNGETTQSITVNSSGTYTATPTAAGFCPSPTSTTVVVNNNPTVSINGKNTICQGTTSTLTTNNPFSQYTWSNGQNTASIAAGVARPYTVTVTDANGCTATNNFNLTVNQNPIPVMAGDFDFCLGANSVLSTTAPFSSYSWSTGVTSATTNVSLPASYTVTVTDANGCTGSVSQLITVYNPPLPAIGGITAICQEPMLTSLLLPQV